MGVFKTIVLSIVACVSASACLPLSPKDAGEKLQKALDSRIGGRLDIRNGVLLAESGEKAFRWTGAAGMADPAAGVPMTVDTPFHTASVGKMFTAVSIARLAEEGRLSLDDPIARYLPAQIMEGLHVMEGRDRSGEILIRHLLCHTSGLPDFYGDLPERGESFLQLAEKDPARFWKPEDTIRFAKENFRPLFSPGGGFHYTDTAYNLLGLILERVTGLPLAEVFARDFFTPLGMSHSRLFTGTTRDEAMAHAFFKDWDVSRNVPILSASWAACGVVSTVEDMAKFMRALAGGALLSDARMTSMRSDLKTFQGIKGIGYGCGFMVVDFRALSPFLVGFPTAWGHSGSTGAFLYYCPELDAVIAGTLDQQAAEKEHMMLVIEAIGILKRLR